MIAEPGDPLAHALVDVLGPVEALAWARARVRATRWRRPWNSPRAAEPPLVERAVAAARPVGGEARVRRIPTATWNARRASGPSPFRGARAGGPTAFDALGPAAPYCLWVRGRRVAGARVRAIRRAGRIPIEHRVRGARHGDTRGGTRRTRGGASSPGGAYGIDARAHRAAARLGGRDRRGPRRRRRPALPAGERGAPGGGDRRGRGDRRAAARDSLRIARASSPGTASSRRRAPRSSSRRLTARGRSTPPATRRRSVVPSAPCPVPSPTRRRRDAIACIREGATCVTRVRRRPRDRPSPRRRARRRRRATGGAVARPAIRLGVRAAGVRRDRSARLGRRGRRARRGDDAGGGARRPRGAGGRRNGGPGGGPVEEGEPRAANLRGAIIGEFSGIPGQTG